MSPDSLTNLIIEYRYLILVPLAFLEGPIIAFIAGTLAAAGYFNPFVLEVFFIARDLINDLAYYMLGTLAGSSKLVKRLLHKIGVTADHLEKANKLWETHPLRTMFLSKISYGIAPSFFVVAGLVRMDMKKFLGYNGLVAAFQYGILLAVGYYFGSALGLGLFNILNNIQYLIGVVVVIYIVLFLVRSFFRKTLLKEENEEA